jgi:hypothetical protein
MPQAEFFGKVYSVSDDYILIKTRAVKWEMNLNFDYFPREELLASYEAYDDVDLVFVDHTYTKTADKSYYEDGIDRRRSRGFVVKAEIDDNEVECEIHLLIAISKEYKMLTKDILNGDVGAVSMGCYADTYCSICGQEFDALNPCMHCPALIGTKFEGELVYEILRNIRYYEISIVFDPASPSALFYEVIE